MHFRKQKIKDDQKPQSKMSLKTQIRSDGDKRSKSEWDTQIGQDKYFDPRIEVYQEFISM